MVADDGAVAHPFGIGPGPAAVFNLGDVGAVRVPLFTGFGKGGVPESISMASPLPVSSVKA